MGTNIDLEALKAFINEEIKTSKYNLKVFESVPDPFNMELFFKGMIIADKHILTYLEELEDATKD